MAYGSIKVDTIVFTNNSADQSVSISGIIASTSGNLTVTGTISGSTVQATYGAFTNLTGVTTNGTTANFTTVSGTTVTGTTANFITVSGTTITGGSGQFTSITGTTAGFTTVTGTTVTGTTANFVTVSGTTVTGTTAQFTSITGGTAGFTTVTGTTVTGTTANFVTVSGTTVTGTTASFTSGVFTNISGTTATFTSGIIASGTFALPSLAFLSDSDTGIFSPGADQLAISTSGTGRLFVDATGKVSVASAAVTFFPTILNVRSTSGSTISLSSADTTTGAADTGVYVDFRHNDGSSEKGAGEIRFLKENSTVGNNSTYFAIVNRLNDAAIERIRIRSDGMFEVKGAGTAGSSPAFSVNGSTPANSFVIDSSGRLGIGNSIPGSFNSFANNLVVGTGTGTNGITIYAGNASTSSLNFADGTSGNDLFPGYITYNHANDSLSFLVNYTGSSAARMFISSAGNVGIGSTGPQGNLHVADAIQANIIIKKTGLATIGNSTLSSVYDNIQLGAGGSFASYNVETATADTQIGHNFYRHSAGNLKYKYADAVARITFNANVGETIFDRAASGSANADITFLESMRLDSSGRLLVGTSTSASAGNSQYSLMQVKGGSGLTSAVLSLTRAQAAASIANNTAIGSIAFGDEVGNPYAYIICESDAASGASDFPGRLVFSTTKDSFSSPTEACRIDSQQNLLIGTTSNSRNARLRVEGIESMHVTGYGNGFGIGIFMTPNASATSGTAEPLRFNNVSASAVGSITTTASATAFNTSSDYRLKENVIPVTDGITRLQQLNPSRFNFIADPYKTVDGFIAHEVQAIVPEAINGEKDAVDEEGNPQYQGIDQSKLVPLLTAALQEAIAKIESLEARLTAAGI